MADEQPPPRLDLVPRFLDQGYDEAQVRDRRAWVEQTCGVALPMVAACAIPTADMRGNIENPIGTVQMPLGVAGPGEVFEVTGVSGEQHGHSRDASAGNYRCSDDGQRHTLRAAGPTGHHAARIGHDRTCSSLA